MIKKTWWLLAFSLTFMACGDDEMTPNGNSVPNKNANAYVAEAVCEKTNVDYLKIAQRLEMPRLKNESDLFVVHTLADGTVNYCMEYDYGKLAARWTAYQWYTGFSSKDSHWNRNAWRTGTTFNGFGGNGDPFQPDPLIPRDFQTTLEDHASNGHDRGHMLGSADRLNSKEANGQTFYLSNMHPQLSGFNQRGVWYTLEERLRKNYDTTAFRDTLYVVKGGTIDQSNYTYTKGQSGRNLLTPKYFFMALLCKNKSTSQGGYKAIAFWMEHKANTDTDVAKYAISIDELEKKTGIDFFCNLPDDIEAVVESNMIPSTWGL